jgi:transposase InsO family protein
VDSHGNEYILVIIDAFSRWVELFPTTSTTAIETAALVLNHIGRFGSPQVIHTDQGPAFHNELVGELLRLCGIQQSFATAYSKEENGIVERANQEVLRHLRALLFDARVLTKWSFEQLGQFLFFDKRQTTQMIPVSRKTQQTMVFHYICVYA